MHGGGGDGGKGWKGSVNDVRSASKNCPKRAVSTKYICRFRAAAV